MNVRERFCSPAFTKPVGISKSLAAFVNEMNVVNAFSESFTKLRSAHLIPLLPDALIPAFPLDNKARGT